MKASLFQEDKGKSDVCICRSLRSLCTSLILDHALLEWCWTSVMRYTMSCTVGSIVLNCVTVPCTPLPDAKPSRSDGKAGGQAELHAWGLNKYGPAVRVPGLRLPALPHPRRATVVAGPIPRRLSRSPNTLCLTAPTSLTALLPLQQRSIGLRGSSNADYATRGAVSGHRQRRTRGVGPSVLGGVGRRRPHLGVGYACRRAHAAVVAHVAIFTRCALKRGVRGVQCRGSCVGIGRVVDGVGVALGGLLHRSRR